METKLNHITEMNGKEKVYKFNSITYTHFLVIEANNDEEPVARKPHGGFCEGHVSLTNIFV